MLATRDIERHLLGALMAYPDAIHRIRDSLTPKHFTEPVHAHIWEIMDVLASEGTPIERAILARRIDTEPKDVPLPVYLAQLYNEAPNDGQIEALRDELADAAMRREARAVLETAAKAMETAKDARAALEGVQGGIARVLATVRSNGGHIATLCYHYLKEVWSPQEKPRRFKSGFYFFDSVVGAMFPANLIVLGGSTSAGKSALAAQVGFAVAERSLMRDEEAPEQMLGVPVLFISLEMEPWEVSMRLLAQRSEIPLWRINENQLNDAEYHLVEQTRRGLEGVPFYVESLPKATPEMLLALVMKYQETHGIGLVIVDHLHYLRSANPKQDRFAAIETIVMDLKANAKQTQIPWLCLAQLSRAVGTRPDKRPHMSDLYGGSEIEKSADVVSFIHREAYWMMRDKPKEGTPEHVKWMAELYGTGGTPEYPASDGLYGKAEIIVEKRRNGRGVGSCMCEFVENLTLFR